MKHNKYDWGQEVEIIQAKCFSRATHADVDKLLPAERKLLSKFEMRSDELAKVLASFRWFTFTPEERRDSILKLADELAAFPGAPLCSSGKSAAVASLAVLVYGAKKTGGVSVSPQLWEACLGNIHNALLGFGLRPDELIRSSAPGALQGAWADCFPVENFEHTFIRNLNTIYSLESKRPGAARVLREIYGIRCFSRYQHLVSQYDSWNNAARDPDRAETIAVINPLTDHNGAFTDGGVTKISVNAEGHDGGTQHIKMVYEAGTPIELLSLLRNSRSLHGRFEAVILNAHGHQTGKSVSLSGQPDGKLSLEHFTEPAVSTICKKLIVKRAPVIIASCNSGKAGGLAEAAWKSVNHPVYAPAIEDGVREIKLDFPDSDTAAIEASVTLNKSSVRVFKS